MKNKDYALTPAISAILAALIVTSTIGTVLVWGVPYTDSLNSEAVKENTVSQMEDISDGIRTLTGSNPGDKKTNTYSFSGGTLSVNDEYDRTVIMYSHDRNYEFTVTDIDDNNIIFKMLNPSYGNYDLSHVTVSWSTCFLAGTKVLMADGSHKEIQDVVAGELVLSYDELSGEMKAGRVSEIFHHTSMEMPDYYLIINGGLKVTPNHRFYSDGRLVYAGDLDIGDKLFSGDKSSYYVYSIERVYVKEPSFDLEIEQYHTYFVSMVSDCVDVLVHNPEPGGKGENLPPSIPDNPEPRNHETDVSVNVILRWSPCIDPEGGTVYYEVYFGYKTLDRNPMQEETWFDPGTLNYNAQYWWKVIAYDEEGNPAEGEMWDFTTESSPNNPPNIPVYSSPPNMGTGISITPTIRWNCSDPDGDPLTYYIYFGTTNPPGLIKSNWPVNNYAVESLQYNTTYYWRIVASDGKGGSTSGPTWRFKTKMNTNSPSVQTQSATDINQTTAVLKGQIINDGGENCQIRFKYALNSYGSLAAFILADNMGEVTWIYPSGWHGSYSTGNNFEENIVGLSPGEKYVYKAGAKNSVGDVWGGYEEFNTTTTSLLSVQTLDVTVLDGTSAMLYGKILNDGGENCQIRFRYREGYNGDWIYISNWHGNFNTNNSEFSELVSGLEPGPKKDYQFQAGAKNSLGEIWGEISNFQTYWLQDVWTSTPIDVTQSSATLKGIFFEGAGGPPLPTCQVRFKYALNSYGSLAAFILADNMGEVTWIYPSGWHGNYTPIVETPFTENIAGLNIGTPYVYLAGTKNIIGEHWADNYVEFITVNLSVQTMTATDVTGTSAILHGKILSNGGEPCQVRFKYAINSYPDLLAFIAADYAGDITWTYPSDWHGSHSTNDLFNENITGLIKNLTYVFRAGGKKGTTHEVWGDYSSFKTGLHEGFENSITLTPQYLGNNTWLIELPVPIFGSVAIDLYVNGPCFLAGTKVVLADGSYKNIEDIKVEDLVKSYNEKTGEILDKEVTNVFHHSPEEMTEYYTIINNDLKVTPNHKFYSNGRWVPAGDLKIGDTLFSKTQGEEYTVNSIDYVYEKMPTFDLEINGCHNYFVSINDDVDVLVHNENDVICFGTIWIFDSNSLVYTRTDRDITESYVLEKNGILSYLGDEWFVENNPQIYSSSKLFSINVVRTLFSFFSKSVSSSDMLKFKLYSTLQSSYIDETKKVYNLRVQFNGDYATEWSEYLKAKCPFFVLDTEQTSYASLKYINSEDPYNNGINLALAHSIVNLKLEP